VLPESFRLSNDFQMKGVSLGHVPRDLFSFSSCRERPLRERGRESLLKWNEVVLVPFLLVRVRLCAQAER
jgi:hypothetical protein